MKNIIICLMIILTSCTTYKAILDVPKAKSDESWSKGISYISEHSLKTFRILNKYYVDTYPSNTFFSMVREFYPEKIHIIITSENLCGGNLAEECKNYILDIKPKQVEAIKDKPIEVNKHEPLKQALLSDIPAPILNELLKEITKATIINKLKLLQISNKDAKSYDLAAYKKLFGLDK